MGAFPGQRGASSGLPECRREENGPVPGRFFNGREQAHRGLFRCLSQRVKGRCWETIADPRSKEEIRRQLLIPQQGGNDEKNCLFYCLSAIRARFV